MIQSLINKLSLSPRIFITLRKILENNFEGQKQVIHRYFLPGNTKTILDLGCGTGEFSVFFNPQTYIGIDIEEKYIRFAKKNYEGTFFHLDATKLPFDSDYFDGIVILGVLHHIEDYGCQSILSEMSRVLKCSGSILVLEDVEGPADGFFTRMIHSLDKGEYIRTDEEYSRLLGQNFHILDSYGIKSGLCPYQVFLLEKK